MNTDAYIKIIGAILTILATVISAYVVPYFRQHITAEDMATLNKIIEIAVRCADQIFTKEQYEEKKAYVTKYVADMVNGYLHIQLTYEQISTLVEGFVNQIHNNGVR